MCVRAYLCVLLCGRDDEQKVRRAPLFVWPLLRAINFVRIALFTLSFCSSGCRGITLSLFFFFLSLLSILFEHTAPLLSLLFVGF